MLHRFPVETASATRASGRRLASRPFFSALLLLGLVLFGWVGSLSAEQVHVDTKTNKDGSYEELWYSQEHDVYYLKVYDKEGNLKAVYVDVNPNPDTGTTTPGDFDMRIDLLKQKGGGIPGPAFEDTPIGKYLGRKGKTLGPLHNPSDDGDGGPSPSNGITFYDPRDDMFNPASWGGTKGGIDLNGRPIGNQLKNLAKRGKKGGSDDEDSNAKPEDGGLWGPEMPGPPELVNPNPARGAFTLLAPMQMGIGNSGKGATTPRLTTIPGIGGAFHRGSIGGRGPIAAPAPTPGRGAITGGR